MKERKRGKWKEHLAETLEFPRDVIFQEAVLTVTGEKELLAENFRKILEYTDQELVLQAKTGRIRVKGEALHILYYTADEMKVTGKITDIAYEK